MGTSLYFFPYFGAPPGSRRAASEKMSTRTFFNPPFRLPCIFLYKKKKTIFLYFSLYSGAPPGSRRAASEKMSTRTFFNPPFRLPCIFLHKKKKTIFLYFSFHSGAPPGSRTPDLLIKSQLLYQLS